MNNLLFILRFLWCYFFVTMPLQVGLLALGIVLLQQKIEKIKASR